jgi:hypothetical protein
MDLLDRYLHAVRFWLPNRQKHDIIAELSEDLRSQIEDKETALGRPVTEAELAALLHEVGRPVVVANRYLPQRHLIGPLWFPIYQRVLMIVAACYLVPWVLVWVGLMTFDPAYRATHTGAGWLGAIGSAWGGFWIAAVVAIGTVTIVFAVLERVQTESGFLAKWDPVKLPVVRDSRKIPRGASIVELVANVVVCSWWVTAMWSPIVLDQPTVRITLAPAWTVFFFGFLILAVANVAAAGVNLLRPYWTRPRAGVRLVTNLIGSALFAAMFKASLVADITVTGVATGTTRDVVNTINRIASQSFVFVVIFGLIVLAVDVRRIVRAGTADSPRSAAANLAGGGMRP